MTLGSWNDQDWWWAVVDVDVAVDVDVDTDIYTWGLLVLYFKGFTSISYSNGFLQYITVSQRMYSRKSLSEKAPSWVNDLDTVVKYQQSWHFRDFQSLPFPHTGLSVFSDISISQTSRWLFTYNIILSVVTQKHFTHHKIKMLLKWKIRVFDILFLLSKEAQSSQVSFAR